MSDMASSIEAYIKAALDDVAALAAIRTWITGAIPETQINEGMYPLCQIFIVPSQEFESSITHWGRRYEGLISFRVSQTTLGYSPDWTGINSEDDTIAPESFAAVRGWASEALDELNKSEHLDMDELTVDGEAVCFLDMNERTDGAGFDGSRPNTWSNVANLRFAVVTEKERE